jgi:hypothetical protein
LKLAEAAAADADRLAELRAAAGTGNVMDRAFAAVRWAQANCPDALAAADLRAAHAAEQVAAQANAARSAAMRRHLGLI